jgi:uncharacterized protein YxjI
MAGAQTPQLPPLQTPMAVFPQFVARQSESIKLRERLMSLSGDSFHVELFPSNQPLLIVKGETFTLSGRKSVMDAQGNHLFDLRKHKLSIPSSYYAEDPQGNRFFSLEGKFSIGSSKSIGIFSYKDPQGALVEGRLLMKGDWLDREANITNEATGQTVARIDRKFFNSRQILGGQQTYMVTCAPGIDMAIICAMCISLDERRNES